MSTTRGDLSVLWDCEDDERTRSIAGSIPAPVATSCRKGLDGLTDFRRLGDAEAPLRTVRGVVATSSEAWFCVETLFSVPENSAVTEAPFGDKSSRLLVEGTCTSGRTSVATIDCAGGASYALTEAWKELCEAIPFFERIGDGCLATMEDVTVALNSCWRVVSSYSLPLWTS